MYNERIVRKQTGLSSFLEVMIMGKNTCLTSFHFVLKGASTSTTENFFGHRAKRARVSGKNHKIYQVFPLRKLRNRVK